MPETDLDRIAADLEGLEETIIHKLIDRAQFRVNLPAYEPGNSGFDGEERLSLFDLRLRYQEKMDAVFGRFVVPEERPFSSDLPLPKRLVSLPPTSLVAAACAAVDLTKQIQPAYLALISRICPEGDDGQYGSSTEHDVYAIQAISRRIHYGALYVAESKYQGDPAGYQVLIDASDADGLGKSLTRVEVEAKIYGRVAEKVESLQAQADPSIRHAIDPTVVRSFYRETIIPLTKEGEVRYLLSRA